MPCNGAEAIGKKSSRTAGAHSAFVVEAWPLRRWAGRRGAARCLALTSEGAQE